MIHKEFNVDDHHSSNYETRRGPFDFVTKSVWQRDAEDKENTEKKKGMMWVALFAELVKMLLTEPVILTEKKF